MSGILKVCLWLVSVKNIRNNSGNSHIVEIDKIITFPIEKRNSQSLERFFLYIIIRV